MFYTMKKCNRESQILKVLHKYKRNSTCIIRNMDSYSKKVVDFILVKE